MAWQNSITSNRPSTSSVQELNVAEAVVCSQPFSVGENGQRNELAEVADVPAKSVARRKR
ncbi:hypothetical protein [Corynebacterium diphtheriae]|uniref:hypothetical protein n=1 Tax=Corynebacterium diphtheriae TaxID=1717 RepID=UPI0015BC885B|nr:hypothetical protein [Corynebacterium diphtheriae]